MNEHSYTSAVLKQLAPHIHTQSMTTASLANNGTPDRYIDDVNDLWVEFKFLPRTPKILRPYELLSPLQMRWLRRRYLAGQNALVVVGFKTGERSAKGLVLEYPEDWEADHLKDSYTPLLRTNSEVAAYIEKRVS